jgi:pimeloyl-ACP methyl ester carboxylesterase
MNTLELRDGDATFEVTATAHERPARVVLFAVGGGGDPRRHAPLLTALGERGISVVAPHFERMTSPHPTEESLLLRCRRLRLALDALAPRDVPVVGIGHSIGAAALLALAGARLWLDPTRPLDVATDTRLVRLALLAPATGFFRAPEALSAVRLPIVAWAGSADTLTPPDQAELLRERLAPGVSVDVQVVEGADHFSFMHALPPGKPDALQDREAFLTRLVAALLSFVTR